MTMTSFLQRMLWKGGDGDQQNVTIGDPQGVFEHENNRKTSLMKSWLENRSHSASNIPEATSGVHRPTRLRLFGTTKKQFSDGPFCKLTESQNLKSPTSRLVEDTVRELGESYKSPTKTPLKKSKNFVKKLVAALERKHHDSECDEVFAMRYSNGPIYAYEQSGTMQKSEDHRPNAYDNPVDDQTKDETFHASTEAKINSRKTTPKIIGAFLKKPIEIDDTSIYWIPITGKKLPRKKSFKKLLDKLTGRSGGKGSDVKTKPVVFASQENLMEDIHDSGYEGRSTSSRTSSLTSITETLYHDHDYVDKTYKDCNFSTFVTSSPLKKVQVGQPKLINTSKDLSKLFPAKETASRETEIREDSGYISNHSILEDLPVLRKNLVATRVQEISYQLAKLPKHPFVRSEPKLHQQMDEERPLSGEIVSFRRFKDEPIYDVPRSRPRSSILDESMSMKRRNVQMQTVNRIGYSGFPVFSNFDEDEQPHYATVKPRNGRSRVSFDNLCQNLSETGMEVSQDTKLTKKSFNSSFADLTANESFIVTMYV